MKVGVLLLCGVAAGFHLLSPDLYTESCMASSFYLLLPASVMMTRPLELLCFSGGCSPIAGEYVKTR